MKLNYVLPNTKIYTHKYHVHVLENALKAGVILENELGAIEKCDTCLMSGRRVKNGEKAFSAKDRIFLFDLQTDKCLVRDILQSKVATAHNFKNIADIYSTAIYLDPKNDGKFEAVLPINVTVKGSYEFELTDDGVVLHIEIDDN